MTKGQNLMAVQKYKYLKFVGCWCMLLQGHTLFKTTWHEYWAFWLIGDPFTPLLQLKCIVQYISNTWDNYWYFFLNSLALDPMCPQVCVQQPAASLMWDKDVPTPVQLASSLISVMCPILISKNENISLVHLIAEVKFIFICFYWTVVAFFDFLNYDFVSNEWKMRSLYLYDI